MIRNAREFLPVELDFGRFNHLRLVREDVVAAGRHIVSFPAGEYDKQSHPMRKKKPLILGSPCFLTFILH